MSRRADAAPHRCSQGGLVLSVPWRPTRRPDPTPTPEPPAELSLPPKMTPPTEPPPEPPTLTPELTRRRHTAFAATTLSDAAPSTAARATAAKLLPADSLSVYPGVFRELQLNRRDLSVDVAATASTHRPCRVNRAPLKAHCSRSPQPRRACLGAACRTAPGGRDLCGSSGKEARVLQLLLQPHGACTCHVTLAGGRCVRFCVLCIPCILYTH